MPRRYSSFGRRNSRDYRQGVIDGQSSFFFGSSGSAGGGGGSGYELLQTVLTFIFMPAGLCIIALSCEHPLLTAFVATFGFLLWRAAARLRKTAWYQSPLPQASNKLVPGLLSELTARYARWITQPETHGQTAPPGDTADVPLPEDVLYKRFNDTTFRCQTLFHWRLGRIWRFVTLSNCSPDSPNDFLEAVKQGARITIDRSIHSESIFADEDHTVLTSLAGYIFHAMRGALTGMPLIVAVFYLYRGLLAQPDNSVAGMIAGLLGAIIGLTLAGVSRTLHPVDIDEVKIQISLWSGSLNGAVNGFLAGYAAHGFLAIGRPGFDSDTWSAIAISTVFLSGNFSLIDELLFRTFSRPTASVTAALLCATFANRMIEFARSPARLNNWMNELAALPAPFGLLAGIAFYTVVGLAFVGGLWSWLFKPFGVLTGALSGCLGGALALLLYRSLELVKLGPASEFLALLKTLPSPEPSRCFPIGLIAGAILGFLNFVRNEFFDKRGFQNIALGEGLLDQIPAPIRTLTLTARFQFEELQVICHNRAMPIVNRDWNLAHFEFLLLGRKGNNYWLIAIYPPPEEKGTEEKRPGEDESSEAL